MVMFAFAFVGTETGELNKISQPVIAQDGFNYSYDDINNVIHVPLKWKDDCNDQMLVVHFMAEHYNNFMLKKMDDTRISQITEKWVCIK